MTHPYHWLGHDAEAADILESYEQRNELYSPALVDLSDPQADE